MANSTGVDARTGRPLSDWDHVQQSIKKILTTPTGSRVMQRDFGSDLHEFVDAKMTTRNVLAAYAAIAIALGRWEPRFRIQKAAVSSATADGKIEFVILGTYFPLGHKGDFSVAEDRTSRVVLGGN